MDRAALRDGLRDIAPALPPNVVFGMLFGATAVEVGISPLQATALSLFTFAATAQVAAVELLQDGTALPVVLATVLVINLRYVVFSASLVALVRDLPRRWRAVIAYPLMDITYALSTARYDGHGDCPGEQSDPGGAGANADATADSARGDPGGHRGWYYVGLAGPLVGLLVVGTAAGALAGRAVGRGLDLEFAIPLIFVGLLVPEIEGKAGAVAALVAAAVAAVAAGLPFNTGLLAGLVSGTAAAAAVDRLDGGWEP